MKILITGGTGFLGSKLVKRLIEEGHDVTLIIRRSTVFDKVLTVRNQFECFLKENDDYQNQFERKKGFDIIIHCATNYGRGDQPIERILEDNLIWPLQLLELGIKFNCRLFINTDSFITKRYSSYEYLKGYSLSKYLLREALFSYSSLINIANCRLEHVYGPNDSLEKFTFWIYSQLRDNVESIKLSDGFQKRDFIHVEDVVNAYSSIIKNVDSIEGFNEFEVGSGESHSIREFVEVTKQLLNNTRTKLSWGSLPLRKNEFEESKADISKLVTLGWRPQYDFENGIRNFILVENQNISNS